MSDQKLPERASLEYLKKLASDRLRDLRRADPQVKLAAALLAVARDHGFPSWRALKAEMDDRKARDSSLFFDACAKGDIGVMRALIANDPNLAHLHKTDRFGGTGLHVVARRGHTSAVRLLLEYRADPNARDTGDNASPLHFAAGYGHAETVRALLDAGADVQGAGDLHQAEVIGWAAGWGSPADTRWEVLPLLLERGAHHHIFSAIAVGDLALIQSLVEQNPEALDRRMSRFEKGQTPLHFAINRKRYDIIELLIELGADLEAEDQSGQTALALAMLRGDRNAMSRLRAAGAKEPKPIETPGFSRNIAELAGSVAKGVPMISVPDIAATLEWYASIGFKEIGRYEEAGVVNFGMLAFGKAELMLRPVGHQGPRDVTLWFYTDQVDALYQFFRSWRTPGDHKGIEFVEDI
jgi:ankyrin repeat protein